MDLSGNAEAWGGGVGVPRAGRRETHAWRKRSEVRPACVLGHLLASGLSHASCCPFFMLLVS